MSREKNAIVTTPAEVIARFLTDMSAAAQRSFPMWSKLYTDGLADAAPEGSALYDQLVSHQPLDDYYFAGIVAFEASKIRRYLDANRASALLSELATQVDRAANRPDRVVSNLVFFIIGRIELESGVELMTMPYDKVIQIMLQHIGLEQNDATRPLMKDFVFRHGLGEPIARGVPAWWKKYAALIKRQTEAAKQSGYIAAAAE
jgi:hypothetical protein